MSTKTDQACLYDQLLFGVNRYLSPVLEAILAASNSHNLNQNNNVVINNSDSGDEDEDVDDEDEDEDMDDEDEDNDDQYHIGQFEIQNINNRIPFL